ncbi:MAG: hypothetical protein ACXVAX_11765 [Pseudobdellovibrio sp.]
MSTSKKVIFLSLLLISIRSFAGVCEDGFNYLKTSFEIDKKNISCEQILTGTDNIKKNVKVTEIQGLEFASSVLDYFNGNRLICGRTDHNLKYNGKFGEVKTVDIRDQVVSSDRVVEKEILLPLLPAGLQSIPSLIDLHAEYVSTSKSDILNQIEIGKLADKELELYKVNRLNLLKGVFKSIKDDNACVERICKEDSVKCQKALISNKGFEFLKNKISDGLQLAPAPTAPASVNDEEQ